ncbi:MAG: helix-turn-helix transcriptional regulator [Clostridia bacterium]|nr:helix-turn-helix transcriptional regulator [Clostridia bacterium]
MEDQALRAGEKLRLLLKEQELTQEEFAFDFNTDIRNVNRWINEGIKKIRTIQDLAEYFHISFVDFFI